MLGIKKHGKKHLGVKKSYSDTALGNKGFLNKRESTLYPLGASSTATTIQNLTDREKQMEPKGLLYSKASTNKDFYN